jgi:phospholipase/lecithinase/hemolysin
MNKIFSQTFKALCAITALAVLSACGGASSTVNPIRPARIIALGDGLNDVGTGSVTDLGGRFTINGTVAGAANTLASPTTVSENLANIYGLWSSTLPPLAMYNASYVPATFPKKGLLSYAKGNSLIATAGPDTQSLDLQVRKFLTQVGGVVAQDDLIVITAGTRDLYDIGREYIAALETTPAKNAAFARLETTVNGANGIMSSIDLLIQAGAKYVLVVEPLNLARTPWGLSLPTSQKDFLRSLAYDADESCLKTNPNNSFHCKLTVALMDKYPKDADSRRVLHVDIAQQLNLWSGTTATGNLNTYLSYGITQPPSTPACSVNVSGYLASDVTKNTGCDATAFTGKEFYGYLFADNFNFTPLGNTLVSNYVYNTKFYQAAWR